MLCTACENFRFPVSATNTNAKAAHTSTTSSSAERQLVERQHGTQLGSRNVIENTVNEPAGAASNKITTLGVTFDSTLSFNPHVSRHLTFISLLLQTYPVIHLVLTNNMATLITC